MDVTLLNGTLQVRLRPSGGFPSRGDLTEFWPGVAVGRPTPNQSLRIICRQFILLSGLGGIPGLPQRENLDSVRSLRWFVPR